MNHGHPEVFDVGKLFSDDVYPSPFAIKHDFAVDQCEQGVIFALSDSTAGVPLVANLTDEDVSSDDFFATEFLDTASLCIGVAAVAAGPLSLLVSHFSTRKFAKGD